ncbi:MAG TPA: malto-oligosyltrehalose trehalohydrolase [bacterium]|nr:malto-oligosyltrehalose trehalohydrolase [bacterium]
MRPGAHYKKGKGCLFRVWAPEKEAVELVLSGRGGPRVVPMKKDESGYFEVMVKGALPGQKYMYSVEGAEPRPDPASFYQPGGVHGASEVIDHSAFKWSDRGFKGIKTADMVIYELHAGVFTGKGTFEAAAGRIKHLKDMGINAVEVMPVAQFPGARNWGYDGAYLYAVQNTYGGTEGLKSFVNECHKNKIAVILDVVYNHLGPEGNYTGVYGPYFTSAYKTPWGDAVNYDGAWSGGVRDYIIENALYWLDEFHIDGLRLDAVHAIFDFSAKHILAEIKERVCDYAAKTGRIINVIAESDLNDSRIVRPVKQGGYGLDAQWADDFHHSLHSVLTGEKSGYYTDFGGTAQLVKVLRSPFVYDGIYSCFRKRRHGNSAVNIPACRFTVFSQNHDQTGNRAHGGRLISLAGEKKAKLAAAFTLMSPYVPLLFMGEEYGEAAPFLYFTSHNDEALIRGVREGRKKEFEGFMGALEPPDPQAEETFNKSKLSWNIEESGKKREMAAYYRELIKIRREAGCCRASYSTEENRGVIRVEIKNKTGVYCCVYNFGGSDRDAALPRGRWDVLLYSYGEGAGAKAAGRKIKISPYTAVILRRRKA